MTGCGGEHLVIRTAAFFSPFDPHNFAAQCLEAARHEQAFAVSTDCVVSPTYVPDLCRTTLDLLADRETGIWHLTNEEPVSWSDFARQLLEAADLSDRRLVERQTCDMGWRAPRPRYSALASARGKLMPGLDHAVARFAQEYRSRPSVEGSPSRTQCN